MTGSRHQEQAVPWVLIAVFFFLTVVIAIAGFFYYENQKNFTREEKYRELKAIADLKVEQIINWRGERLGDARIISEDHGLALIIQQWFTDPSSIQLKNSIVHRMATLIKSYGYQSVILLDIQGNEKLSVPEGSPGTTSHTKKLALEALHTNKVLSSDLHYGKNGQDIHMDILAPLSIHQGLDNKPVGVMVLRINPNDFLYPMLQSWPTPSESGEVVLLRREGDEVLFLNELRHRKNAALSLRRSISAPKLLAAMALRGKTGVVMGLDYRDVAVIGTLEPVPDSPWFIVAKVNEEEVDAPVRRQAWLIFSLIIALVAGAGVSTVFIWRNAQTKLLAAERQRFYAVLEMLPVYVVLLTPDHHVPFANRTFRERFGESQGRRCYEYLFGRTEPCEVCETYTVLKTRKPHEWGWTGPDGRDYYIYDYPFTDVDGSPLILEMGIDITERKQAVTALRESEEKYRTLIETTGTGYAFVDSHGKVIDANQEYVRLSGHISLEAILGRSVVEWTAEHDRERNAAELVKCLQQGYVRGLEIDYVDEEGRITPIEINGTVLTTGQSVQMMALCRDITDRKRAEEALQESEKRFRDVAENAQEWVWEVDAEGKYTYVSPIVEKLLGYKPEEMLNKHFYDCFFPEDREELKKMAFAAFAAKQPIREFINRNLHKDGSVVWLSTSGVPILDKTGNLLGYRGADTDITVRRKSMVRLKCISQLNEDLILSPCLMERLKRVTDGVVEIFDADFARIWILKPGDLCDSGCLHAETLEGSAICRSREYCLHLVASSGRYPDIDSASHRRVPLGCFKIGRIALGETNKFLTNDVTRDPQIHNHEWARSLGLAAFAGYRLLSSDKTVLGVLALFSKHSISSEEDAMLEGIAGTTSQLIQRGKAEEELQESEQRFRAMFEKAADAIVLADVNTKTFLMGNEMFSKMLGYGPDEIRQLGVLDIHPPEDLPYVLEQFERQVKQEIAVAQELPVKRKDGSVFYADVNAFPIIIEGKSFLMGVFRDITERRQAVQALQETNGKLEIMVIEASQRNRETTLITGMSESLQSCLAFDEAYAIIAHAAQQLFASVSGGLLMLDPAGNFLEVVASWGETLDGEQVFAPNNCWAIRRGRMHLSGGSEQNERCRHLPDNAGKSYFCLPLMAQEGAFGLLHLQALCKGGCSVIDQIKDLAVTVGDNISLALANLKLRETLRQQVIHDPLTGLFNRRYLSETLEREVHRVKRKGATLGVIMMDLDHFKRFNDTYGHEAGDLLLQTLGKFLETQVRQEDIACRYGGEEFVLIMPEASLDVTQKRAEEIRQGVSQLKVSHRGRMLEMITVSLGVAIFPDHGATGEDVLRTADDAMYQAKREGRNRVVVAGGGVEPSSAVE